jgi:hypothetical protein
MKIGDAIQEQLRIYLKEGTRDRKRDRSISLDPKTVASTGPLYDTYLLYSDLSADSAHPTVTSLNRHFKPGADGNVRRFLFTPPSRSEEITDTLTFVQRAGAVR